MNKTFIESAFRLCIFFIAVSGLQGCGYHFQGSTSSLPQDIRTVFISPVENYTTEPRLGLEVREALISSFERYGIVDVVDDKTKADAILDARIVALQSRTKNVSGSNDISLQEELAMVVAGELRRKSGQVLWRDDAIQATSSFADVQGVVVTSSSSFAQGGIGTGALGSLGSREVSRGQQQQALEDLTDEITRKLYLEAVAADF